MATRPDDIQTFAPRPGEEVSIGRPLGEGEAIAFGTTPAGQTSVATNVPALQGAFGQLGFQSPPRPPSEPAGTPSNLLAIDRPMGVSTGPALTGAQQQFLAGERVRQPSSPLPTPAQQAEARKAEEAAEFEDRFQKVMQLKTGPARVAAEGREKVESIKQDAMNRRNESTIGSKERIQANKDFEAMAREKLKSETATGNTRLITEARREVAEASIAGAMDLAISKGLVPGTPQFDQATNAATNHLITEGIIQSQLQADEVSRRAMASLAGSAFKTFADPFADDAAKAQAKAIIDTAVKSVGAPAAEVAAPTPQATAEATEASPASTSENFPDSDGDGVPAAKADVQKAEQIVSNGWNKDNVKTIQNPQQRAAVERALMLMDEVNRVRKANLRTVAETAENAR